MRLLVAAVLFASVACIAQAQDFSVNCTDGDRQIAFDWLPSDETVMIDGAPFALVSLDEAMAHLSATDFEYQMMINADGTFTEIDGERPPRVFEEVTCELQIRALP